MTSDSLCLELFRALTEMRANGRCEICGAPEGDPHHIYSRGNKAVRYDAVYNGLWLCNIHHRWAEEIGTKELIKYLTDTKTRSKEWAKELNISKNFALFFSVKCSLC